MVVPEHPRGLCHPSDVLGRSAATAADHRRAKLDGAAQEHVEVLWGGHVEQAAVDVARQAGVRLHRQRKPRPSQPLGDGERELRAVATVHADRIRAPVAQRAGHLLRCGTVGDGACGVERHGGDDRDPRCRLARGLDRDSDLRQMAERLQHESVSSAFDQRRRLLGKRREHERELRLRRDPGHEARRPHRTCHPHLLTGRLARQSGAGYVVRMDLVGQAMAVEAEAIGAECVRLEHLRPRVAVVGVDPLHDIRSGHVELLEVLGDEDPALVEQRTHGAVEDEQRLHGL